MSEESRRVLTYGVGTRAVLDTFAGLVPCKVLSVKRKSPGYIWGDQDELTVRLTDTVGAYRRGEVLQTSAHECPPVKQLRKKRYDTRINPDYEYVPTH